MDINSLNKNEYIISDYELNNVQKLNYLIFDLEATGLDIEKEYITQFGAVLFENGKINNKKRIISYIHSPKKISKFISNLTGITNSNIEKAPSIEKIIKPLWEKYGDYIWVAQCGFEFDFLILKRQLLEKGITWFKPQIADTKVMYTYLYKNNVEVPSTDYLIKKYKLHLSNLQRHNALKDSIIVSKILSKILEDYKKYKIKNIKINTPIKIKKFLK